MASPAFKAGSCLQVQLVQHRTCHTLPLFRHSSGLTRTRPIQKFKVRAEEAPEKLSGVQEGSRVRVTRSVPVFHSLKFKEGLDLEGKEGEVVADVSQYKGKVLSSTLPYKVLFMVPHDEAGEVKIIAHLNGTEFEPL